MSESKERTKLQHKPVMINEVLKCTKNWAERNAHLFDSSSVTPYFKLIDATFGGGGYTNELLSNFPDRLKILGIDRDIEAINRGRVRFKDQKNLELTCIDFANIDKSAGAIGWQKCDLIVFDYGLSSIQLDDPNRGFAFSHDGPLDMRMGDTKTTAVDLVNILSKEKIADLLYYFADETRSRHIADAIVKARLKQKIETTHQLAKIIEDCFGNRHSKSHVATRTFMALRIAVNDEYQQIGRALLAAAKLLNSGGILMAVTFHSQEDRIVKRFFKATGVKNKESTRNKPNRINSGLFVYDSLKPVNPERSEILNNRRARSAKLRYASRGCLAYEDYFNEISEKKILHEIGAFSTDEILQNQNK